MTMGSCGRFSFAQLPTAIRALLSRPRFGAEGLQALFPSRSYCVVYFLAYTFSFLLFVFRLGFLSRTPAFYVHVSFGDVYKYGNQYPRGFFVTNGYSVPLHYNGPPESPSHESTRV